jgi:hypothetical protein
MKWKNASGILCDRRVPIYQLKENFCRNAYTLNIFYGIECCVVKKHHLHKISITKMRMSK